MDAATAGRSARALELIHSACYFAPETEQYLVAVGLEAGPMCYFAGRSAVMGAVPAGVVSATFYNFNPDGIANFIPRAWTLAKPAAIVAARYQAVDAALTRLWGQEVIESAELREAADLASVAAKAIPNGDGKPLYAAHAEVAWPESAHMVLWHALTLLRECRGDGHIAVLQTVGLNGIEALITHTATGLGFQQRFAMKRRAWSQAQWDAAAEGLRGRGVLGRQGELTEAGTMLRRSIEAQTSELALAQWAALGNEGAARLVELGTPLRDRLVASGLFPPGVFGPAVMVGPAGTLGRR